MTNLPERIFLETDVRKTYPVHVEKSSETDIEYIRKDLAEDIAKEFGAYVYLTKDDDERITDHVVYFNGLFTEFLNSRKAEK